MSRNKEQLKSRAQIASAVLTLYEISKLLHLPRHQFDKMFTEDVETKINHVSYPGFLPYAEGLRDAYLTAIIKDHCEFVYFVNGERLTIDEARQKGPAEMTGGVCGYQWLGTEFDFTEFHKEIDLWI